MSTLDRFKYYIKIEVVIGIDNCVIIITVIIITQNVSVLYNMFVGAYIL